MSATVTLLSILGAVLIGAASPGPSFVFVSRTAAVSSRMDGIAAAVGMGAGGVIFAALAMLGFTTVLRQVGWLYAALRVLGGLYLILLAFRMWLGATMPVTAVGPAKAGSRLRFLWLGFMTQVSNPKTAIMYASIFAALLPPQAPTWMLLLLLPLLLALETAWYTIVALAFSAPRPRSAYLHWKVWVDAAAGTVMGALGVRLVSEAVLPTR